MYHTNGGPVAIFFLFVLFLSNDNVAQKNLPLPEMKKRISNSEGMIGGRLIEYRMIEGFIDDLLQRSQLEEEETLIETFGIIALVEGTYKKIHSAFYHKINLNFLRWKSLYNVICYKDYLITV